MISVVVIGNGPSALKTRCGPKIDEFDVVVRLNNFRLQGYEEHVGSKTTIWARNVNAGDVATRDPNQFDELLICPQLLELRWAAHLRWFSGLLPLTKLVKGVPNARVVPAEVVERVTREAGLSTGWVARGLLLQAALTIAGYRGVAWIIETAGFRFPSTGLIAIGYCIERYGHATIHGFDGLWEQEGEYFDPNKRVEQWKRRVHSTEAERRYILRQRNSGKLDYLVPESSTGPLEDVG